MSSGQGAVDVFRSVRRGEERRFELRRREEDSPRQHLPEESCVAFCIRTLRVGIISYRPGREKDRRERADGVDLSGDFGALRLGAQTARSEERRGGKGCRW